MDWSDLGKQVANAAPILGTILGGPGGTAIGSLIASAFGTGNDPAAISAAITANPDAAIKLKQIESDNQVQLATVAAEQAKALIAAQTQNASDVNKTMQSESTSDHWPTYSWRPFIGFVFGLMGLVLAVTISVCYISVMFFKADAAPLATLPAMLGAMIGIMGVISPVLGIASYFRGKMQANPTLPTDNRG